MDYLSLDRATRENVASTPTKYVPGTELEFAQHSRSVRSVNCHVELTVISIYHCVESVGHDQVF